MAQTLFAELQGTWDKRRFEELDRRGTKELYFSRELRASLKPGEPTWLSNTDPVALETSERNRRNRNRKFLPHARQ